MNLVKTYIDKSSIEGIGLFAGEFIPKGTLIWKLIEPFDLVFDKEVFTENVKILPVCSIESYVNRYLYEMNNKVVLCGDDARFANHSDNANTESVFDKQWAKIDIRKGEEITCNYSEINDDFDESEFEALTSNKNL